VPTAEAIHPASVFVEPSKPSTLHVLTLTPFYPSETCEVNGCFVAESLAELSSRYVLSSVIGVDTIYHPRRIPSTLYPAEWVRCPQLPGNFGLASAGKFLAATLLPKITRLHRRSPIHLIHAHSALPCGHAASLISRRLDIPFVVTIHGLDVFNSCFQNGIAAKWRKNASIRVYRSARKLICISQKVKQLLIETMGAAAHAEVVYNGTDTTLFAPMRDDQQFPAANLTILVVGNLLAGKGQELVIQAIARLQNLYPHLRCDFIGEGTDHARFAVLAVNVGIGDRIRFLGSRSRSEVAEAMRRCTVFALPSRYEGLGCVYLEAMACGKPVVACEGQGIGEIIRHRRNGWLIPVDGLDELTQGLRILLGDAELRTRIGEAARQTIASEFNLAHHAESLLKIYQDAAR
jgi:teichuronic acid biosynthesis glycosyltransferase TuaC